MSDPTIRRVVVGVDCSPSSEQSLRFALEEGACRGWPVVTVLAWSFLSQVHLSGADDFSPTYGEEEAQAALEAFVADVRSRAEHTASVEVQLVTVLDLAAPALLGQVTADDLLVVGARGLGGFKGLLLGSVSQHCVTHAPCPVVVVRGKAAAAD